jgi:ribosomal protein L11 methyltransferase
MNPEFTTSGASVSSSLPDDLWQLELVVPLDAVEIYAQALEPLAHNVSWMLDEVAATANLQAIQQGPFDLGQVRTALELAAMALGASHPPSWTHARLPACNWLAQNQMDFPPLRMESFYIYGSHHRRQPPPLATVGLLIDAATAFGTGEHATTRGCLRALRQLRRAQPLCARILDMGCGTGILAIAAAKLWPAAHIASGDIEAESVRVTRINTLRNQVQRRVRTVECNGFATRSLRVQAPYDVIVANILAKPLCRMAAEMNRHLHVSPQATIVLSGLLRSQIRMVMNAYHAVNFAIKQTYDIEGWITLVLIRG